MALSVFDLFSIGIGPSSSHTVGPMRAANMFLRTLAPRLEKTVRVNCVLYGSLGYTGKGHGTDTAVILGLMGETPETADPRQTQETLARIRTSGRLDLDRRHPIDFREETDIELKGEIELPAHPNGMRLEAFDGAGRLLESAYYYSVGGGFVVGGDAGSMNSVQPAKDGTAVPYPYRSMTELLEICRKNGLTIAQAALENELVWRSREEIRSGLLEIRSVMDQCIDNGLHTRGILPGGLHVPRRAPELFAKLGAEGKTADPLAGMDWLTLYALAVNEENAAGGRIVTAPTNGAAGIIPAVLRYYNDFIRAEDEEGIISFFLTAGAIGIIFKTMASISGAEVGCQGEVGSACSMAAGAMAAILGGTPEQIENAAEIGMEHNLGLTCDPIAGLVQIPCIERNAIAAVKAVAAARTALRGDGKHLVSLDSVIKTMRETGLDMQSKYKETSLGGLAVNVTIC
ncbi:L-serine ammonia-lyase [Arcanobacterium sp. S3PF19]|uniref:L-serine ammonia-lyase n=1 Tax=Arcanobacterium sp. S3PF19 TaxID=1219585 RepID=UPI00050EBBD4|nr:L-serine ammonia-lyase [Arcanobacterium sp. S3PF19]KGF06314.1 serine ammonia-lyase [Arcanobacterium sp. S3PF19]